MQMSKKPMELRVEAENNGDCGLAQFRKSAQRESQHGEHSEPRLVIHVNRLPMRAVVDQIPGTIRQTGHRASDLARTSSTPVQLAAEPGVRLSLLSMTDHRVGRRSQKAMRILLARE